MKEAVKEARKEAHEKAIAEVLHDYSAAVDYYRQGHTYYLGALVHIIMWRIPDADVFEISANVEATLKEMA